ncbi:MAG: methyltransferase domain-containing protein, partial [Flavobacteriales bacterium]|nr:methyltransferase domain-containing protein [Flavobacteriales bacterium]
MKTINSCTVCEVKNLQTVLNFGQQPLANRFLDSTSSECNNETHGLALGLCNNCGIIQLTERMPVEAIRPRFDWLIYNEPEEHLDDVVANLITLPGIGSNSKVLGTTYKDKSVLTRLEQLGVTFIDHIRESDLKESQHPFGLETIQCLLQDKAILNNLKKRYEKVDLLVVRHILEHSSSVRSLLTNMSELIKPDGYIMFEIPDSSHIFQADNYSFIWEEHISYFTESAIGKIANSVGAEVVWMKRYSYSYEDSLVAVLRFCNNKPTKVLAPPKYEVQRVLKLLNRFAMDLEGQRSYWRKKLKGYNSNNMPVAVFGAGHLAVKFINFLQLKDLINCVIDDDTNK